MESPDNQTPHPTTPFFSNYSLLVPYAAPYAIFVLMASLGGGLPDTLNYSLRLVLTTAALAWAWRWYIPLTGPKDSRFSILYGASYGVVGLVLWIVLCAPFAPHDAAAWEPAPFYLRMAAAATVVPLAEELLLRGYVFRLAYQWDLRRKQSRDEAFHSALFEQTIGDVKEMKWSLPAVAVSTVAFALGHQPWEWPAAVVYGLLMCFLVVRRQDLIACVVAHSVTNIGLALYVTSTGNWQYW
jgi:CAAX prenyl protease-like protein